VSDLYTSTLKPDKFKLFLHPSCYGKSLDHDHCTLDEYGICDEHLLYIKPYALNACAVKEWLSTTITVKVSGGIRDGRSCKRDDVPQNCTALDLKDAVKHEMKIDPKTYILVHDGKELQEDCSLAMQAVPDNATLYLALCPLREMLCASQISKVRSYDLSTEHERYSAMMLRWIKTKETNKVVLRIQQVYSIQLNFEQKMSVYEAMVSSKKVRGREEMLFHGTSLQNVQKILHSGFNRDYNGRSMYGKGTYFSNEARIASRYSTKDQHHDNLVMLACWTYIGESTKGRAKMADRELYKQDKVTPYDSLVDDVTNPHIFVINRDYHSVPCFVVEFTVSDKRSK